MNRYSDSACSQIFQATVIVLALLFTISIPAQAQVVDSLSIPDSLNEGNKLQLTEAIQVAIANNPDIKRSILSLGTADEEVKIAWSSVLPDVSGSVSYTRNLEIPVNFVPAKFFNPNAPADELVPLQFGTDNNWQGGISVQQTLFRGEAFVGISTSKLYKAAQAENLRAATQQIVTQARLAYYSVLVAEEQLRLQEATVERLEKNLKENIARQKAGLIDEYAVLQVRVQLQNQKPQLTQAKYQVEQAYRELKMILGVPLNLNFDVQGDLNDFRVTASEAVDAVNSNIKKVDKMTPYEYQKKTRMVEKAADLRGDIRILETRNELKGQEIKAIKSRFLPNLSASYNLNWSAAQAGNPVFFGTQDTRARSQTVGVTLSLPIFQGFERTANLDIAQIEKKDLEIQKHNALRSAKNEIQSARESLNQALETAPARREALELARKGYNRARARLENGLGSQLDVTNAELQLRQAEANYAQMVYSYLSAKARYDLAIGMVPFVDNDTPTLNEY